VPLGGKYAAILRNRIISRAVFSSIFKRPPLPRKTHPEPAFYARENTGSGALYR
jgi:hypothetical protein